MTLNRAKIIDELISLHAFHRNEAVAAVESALKIIKQSLEGGEDVLISGFGKFMVKNKRPRRGRNPQTSEDLIISARRVVVFRPSGVLRDRINRAE